jgi:hypothetical protein
MWKLVLAALSALTLAGCSQTLLTEELPTRPNPSAVLVPLPGPVPAAPRPTPTPDPTVDPSSCTNPIPPEIARIDVVIHIHGPNHIILDSTPLVGPDADYCRAIGYTDGRRFCPTRPEGHPQHVACDALRVGTSPDTGRIGPTWDVNGRPCDGAICQNDPDNQFLLITSGPGTFEACILRTGVCGAITIP